LAGLFSQYYLEVYMGCCGRSVSSSLLQKKPQTTRAEIDARSATLTDQLFAKAPITLNVPDEETLRVNEANTVEVAQ
jgi:hypothetical protein